MTILTIRTNNPEAELGLYDNDQKLSYTTWPAHRQLAETIHLNLRRLLEEQVKSWADITGIVVYKGPGSFTGLRIGLSVANALAHSLGVPIVGTSGDDWQADGIQSLLAGTNETTVIPMYGTPVHITSPKK